MLQRWLSGGLISMQGGPNRTPCMALAGMVEKEAGCSALEMVSIWGGN
jgi:hypothetical protein